MFHPAPAEVSDSGDRAVPDPAGEPVSSSQQAAVQTCAGAGVRHHPGTGQSRGTLISPDLSRHCALIGWDHNVATP